MKDFRNKNCLIVGASGGIGSQIAYKMAELNCNLFLVGRNKTKLSSLAKKISSQNKTVRIEVSSADLVDDLSINKLIKNIRRRFHHIDILINAAGFFIIKPLENSSIKEFDKCFAINVRAPFIFSREFSKDMKKRKWGRIINIGSSSSYAGFKDGSIYCSSKHSILGLSRALFTELKDSGIRTFCISPGSAKTRMGRKSKNQDYLTFIEPSEIAEYVKFVISFDKELISEEVKLNRINIM